MKTLCKEKCVKNAHTLLFSWVCVCVGICIEQIWIEKQLLLNYRLDWKSLYLRVYI